MLTNRTPVSDLLLFHGRGGNVNNFILATKTTARSLAHTCMSNSHLACDGSTEPVSCPYSPFRAASLPVARTCRRWHCTVPARAPCEGRCPHGLRTISVRKMVKLHGNCTDNAWFPYNLRTVSVPIYPGLPPIPVEDIARCP